MAEWIKICKAGEIEPGQMKGFQFRHAKILVAHTSDGFYALANECSHDSAPIDSGRIENDQVVCPRHGAKFDLKTGNVTAPPAVVGIDVYEVKIEDDEIFVRLD